MKTKICSIFGLAAFVIAPLFAGAAINLNAIKPDGFARGVVFTVDGYTGSSTLSQVPVLVRLSTDIENFDYGDIMLSGGGDIRFVAADGTALPHEIDTWNAFGESLVWVTLPSLESGTEFAMFYRASANDAAAVSGGNAWADFAGVWHLNDSGSGAVAVADSSGNGLNAVGSDTSSSVASGKIGGSWRTGNDREKKVPLLVNVSSDATKKAVIQSLGSDFTASFWACPRGDVLWCTYIATKTTEAGAGWGLQWNDSKKDLRVFGGTTRTTTSASDSADSGRIDPTSAFADLQTQNVWHKIDLVFRTDNGVGYFDLYQDGVLGASGKLRGDSPVSQNGNGLLGIGGCPAAGSLRRLNGEMDEVRVGAFVPTADRVLADYETVADEDFLLAGAVQTFESVPKPVVEFAIADTGAAFLEISGTVSDCGGDATAVDVYAKAWPSSGDEPASWTLLASGVAANGTFDAFLTGLDPLTEYTYAFKAVNNLETPYDSDITTGMFTTSGVGDAGDGGTSERQLDEFVHTFLVDERGHTTFTFTPPAGVTEVDALVVAGGGPGGYYAGGGGGAGGLIYTNDLAVTPLATYTITVGTGGVASESASVYGTNGGDSSIVGDGISITAVGGGAGGNGPLDNQTATSDGYDGGSGGGASGLVGAVAGVATGEQGSAGGRIVPGQNDWANHGGGGGGKGGVGQSLSGTAAVKGGGAGGIGTSISISGASVYYAGGGGGGGAKSYKDLNYGMGGDGGSGGGGKGGQETGTSGDEIAESGVDGLGGGGGGGSTYSEETYKGGDGGSGIVIIRYGAGGDGDGVTAPTISLTGLTYADTDDTTGAATVTYRVGWAGDGYDRADVLAIWGYSEDDLDSTNAIASAAIGQGTGSFTLTRVNKTVYVRLVATNATDSGTSPEIKSVVLTDPRAPVGEMTSATPDATRAQFAASVTGFGDGEGSLTGEFQICGDRFFDAGTYTSFPASETLTDVGPLTGSATGLSPNTVYWVRAAFVKVIGNDAHTYETAPISFTTNPAGVMILIY